MQWFKKSGVISKLTLSAKDREFLDTINYPDEHFGKLRDKLFPTPHRHFWRLLNVDSGRFEYWFECETCGFETNVLRTYFWPTD